MSHTLEKEVKEEIGWGDMREMEGVAKREIVKLRVKRKANPGKKQKEKTGQEKMFRKWRKERDSNSDYNRNILLNRMAKVYMVLDENI